MNIASLASLALLVIMPRRAATIQQRKAEENARCQCEECYLSLAEQYLIELDVLPADEIARVLLAAEYEARGVCEGQLNYHYLLDGVDAVLFDRFRVLTARRRELNDVKFDFA
ncbi:MAG: hypothetical protein DI585_05045 [Pseudomonas fluorescens]|nr:MAG: hypothetical protein DI585_05045 [Pseudomonas fluorescens]